MECIHAYTCIQMQNIMVHTADTVCSAVTTGIYFVGKTKYRFVFLKEFRGMCSWTRTSQCRCVCTVCLNVCHLQTPRWYLRLHRCCDSLPAWFWQAGDSASLSSPDNQRVNMPKQKWVTCMSNRHTQKSLHTISRFSMRLTRKLIWGGK